MRHTEPATTAPSFSRSTAARSASGKRWLLAALACSALPAAAQLGPAQCGSLTNGYGPYDYRTDRGQLPIVEGAHFTPEVEMLIRGKGGYLGGDLDYTLRAFPNHHRALLAMMRYGERSKMSKPPHVSYEIECYFVRAVSFRANDTTVRMLFATYLNKNKRRDEALQQLAQARPLAGDNPFTHYNLGLAYLELGEHDKALEEAHLAMALDFPRTELKERLVAANKWRDPAPAAAAASAPPGTAGAPTAAASAAAPR